MTQEFEVPKEVEKAKCTLSDNELSTKCHEWIDKLCKSGAHAWCLRVPVDFNNDPDVLFTELLDRFMRNHKPVEDKVNWDELHKRWDMHWGGLDKAEQIFEWFKAKLQYNVSNRKELPIQDIDALRGKANDFAKSGEINPDDSIQTVIADSYLAGYKQCLEDRGSDAIPVEDVRKLYDGTIQNVGTSVKRVDMPTFDQWLAKYKSDKNKPMEKTKAQIAAEQYYSRTYQKP